jgi:hypothetical protein
VACLDHANVEHRVTVLEGQAMDHQKRLASLEGLKLMAVGAFLAWGPMCALLAFLYKNPQALSGVRAVVGGQP